MEKNNNAPRRIIFDTDWWSDCDDCVALRLLCRAHAAGEIELIGVTVNAAMEYSAASVSAFLTSEGLPDIPVGIDRAAVDFAGVAPYQKRMAAENPHSIKNNGDAPDAAELLFRLLSECGGKCEIVAVGFLQVLAQLLRMPGGRSLAEEKISRVWCMAGKWDENPGREHNFINNLRSREGAAYFCDNFPGEIIFLGFEVGLGVYSGSSLREDDILYKALADFGCDMSVGRHSWDPMTALCALMSPDGDVTGAGYTLVRGRASVDPVSGENSFVRDKNGRHAYLVKTLPDRCYSDEINKRAAK